jgi:putative peptidoglycan lipid II flippase
LIQLIAPGFDSDPRKFATAVELTHITFPYLAFITIATLHTGTLNANGFFAVGAFAPVLLNLFIMGFLAIAFLFPNPGVAASWGVLVSGIAQLWLLIWEARRRNVLERLAWPRLDPNVRQFFRALGPAVIGSAGQQIAILADTILASAMPTGAVASINYADRLYQLPLGVIGVAAGTVLLPEMTRRLAAGDSDGAARAQNRSIALSLALSAPFLVGFLMIPEELIRGAYMRGVFDAEAVRRSANVLQAYGIGLIPMVLIRSAVATFQSRGDTKTPMFCFFGGLAANLILKVTLSRDLGVVGLALGTAVGAWINFGLLILIGRLRDLALSEDRLYENIALMLFSASGSALATPVLLNIADGIAAGLPFLRNEFVVVATFGGLSLTYGVLYSLTTLLFGRSIRRQLF